MKKGVSMLEYTTLSPGEKRQLARDFLELARSKYPDAEFGVHSFPELDYNEIVLGNLLAALEDWGYTERIGRMARFKK